MMAGRPEPSSLSDSSCSATNAPAHSRLQRWMAKLLADTSTADMELVAGNDESDPEDAVAVPATQAGDSCDVVLAHRCLFAVASPVFHTMLLGSFREGTS